MSTNTESVTDGEAGNGRESSYAFSQEPEPFVQTQPVEYAQTASEMAGGGTQPYAPASAASYSVPVRPVGGESYTYLEPPAPAEVQPVDAASSLLVPKGAVEMLGSESVVFQLGALYLTNKRVILLAPSVLRTAFLRDVDAIGTLTERASGWSFFFGLLMLALAGGAVYLSIARSQFAQSLEPLYKIDPIIIAIVLGVFAIYLLVNYFFWVKRTLFLSVGGRPLITVSITDWNTKKLAGMDSFINAFSQAKETSNSSEVPENG